MGANMEFIIQDRCLNKIAKKVISFERLDYQDGIALFKTNDLMALSQMAFFVKRQKTNDGAYFVINKQINPSNICALSCKFCNFSKKRGEDGAYELNLKEILSYVDEGLTEVHIVGGLHPDWPFEYYVHMISSIAQKRPNVGIKAWTAVEIDYFSKKFGMSIEKVLSTFKDIGLSMMPGGGAEVFSDRIRKELFPQKIGAARWLEIHKIAHEVGIPTNATMLYGHIETIQERVGHLLRLRNLQDQTKGFLSFIPLTFQPGNKNIKSDFMSGVDDMKVIAVSRLLLDNVSHIKAYWVMLEPSIAEVALRFGADDLDGTVGKERIAHAAGAKSPINMAKAKMIGMIHNVGLAAIERDMLYNPVNVYSIHKRPIHGHIPFLNSVPFYTKYLSGEESSPFLSISTIPSMLGIMARKGQLDAGLLSLVDFFGLENSFDILPYGIAAKDEVKSILLFSSVPIESLSEAEIGVTTQTATSIRLLEVILRKKFSIFTRIKKIKHYQPIHSFKAVLFIGNDALYYNKIGIPDKSYVYDLASIWHEWTSLPFVFAVMAIRKSLSGNLKQQLVKEVEASLKDKNRWLLLGRHFINEICLDDNDILSYYNVFSYRLSDKEFEAMGRFRQMLKELSYYEHD